VAVATSLSIGTSNKVSVDYQSQEVSVSVTYELERHETDILAFVTDKAAEVEQAHTAVWRRIREIRAEQKTTEEGAASPPPSAPQASPAPDPTDPTTPEEPGPTPSNRSTGRTRRNGANGQSGASTPEDLGDNPFGLVPGQDAADPTALNTTDTNGNGSGNGSNGSNGTRHDGGGSEPASAAQQRAIYLLARRAQMGDTAITELLQDRFAKRSLDHLTRSEAGQLLLEMQRTDREKSQLARVG